MRPNASNEMPGSRLHPDAEGETIRQAVRMGQNIRRALDDVMANCGVHIMDQDALRRSFEIRIEAACRQGPAARSEFLLALKGQNKTVGTGHVAGGKAPRP